MTTRSAIVNLSRPSRWIPKPRLKRLQSTFAVKLRKANYLSISVMRLKLAELNWLKLALPNPTYKAHCFPQLNIHKFHRRQDNAQWMAYIWLPWSSNSSRINRDSKKTKHNWARAVLGLGRLSFPYKLRMGKNAEPQKERRSNEPGSNGPVFTWGNWRNFNSSSRVNPSPKKGYPARTADPAWVLFQVNAYKHFTARGLPTSVIQPGLKSSPESCKEALSSRWANDKYFHVSSYGKTLVIDFKRCLKTLTRMI